MRIGRFVIGFVGRGLRGAVPGRLPGAAGAPYRAPRVGKNARNGESAYAEEGPEERLFGEARRPVWKGRKDHETCAGDCCHGRKEDGVQEVADKVVETQEERPEGMQGAADTVVETQEERLEGTQEAAQGDVRAAERAGLLPLGQGRVPAPVIGRVGVIGPGLDRQGALGADEQERLCGRHVHHLAGCQEGSPLLGEGTLERVEGAPAGPVLAGEPGDLVEHPDGPVGGVRIAYAEEALGDAGRRDGVGGRAVDRADLPDVLGDEQRLDSEAGADGGDVLDLAQPPEAHELVEHQQEWALRRRLAAARRWRAAD